MDESFSQNDTETPFLNDAQRKMKRLMGRDMAFFQTSGKLSIKKRIKKKHKRSLYYLDYFHSLVNMPFYRIVVVLVVAYLSAVSFFAIFYHFISINYGA